MAKYNGDYADECLAEYTNATRFKADEFKKARMEVGDSGDDFGPIPVRQALQLLGRLKTNPLSDETCELREVIAKHLVLRKNVQFFWGADKAGDLTMLTALNQDLGADQFLMENPAFYEVLIEVTTGHVLKKFTPPRTEKAPQAGAAQAGEGSSK